jgi:hypothetical protein
MEGSIVTEDCFIRNKYCMLVAENRNSQLFYFMYCSVEDI